MYHTKKMPLCGGVDNRVSVFILRLTLLQIYKKKKQFEVKNSVINSDKLLHK